jgi:hypothetical protein
MVLDRFIAKWASPNYPPNPVDPAGLDFVEAHFQFKFPSDYRSEVLRFGLPRLTISLLHSIVEGELDIFDVSRFLEPSAMIELTDGWRKLGLSSTLVAFATDCMGSLFCFDVTNNQRRPTSPVWFFDHDFGTNESISPNFTAWIERFCEVDLIHSEDE